jgi:hypothetical protein
VQLRKGDSDPSHSQLFTSTDHHHHTIKEKTKSNQQNSQQEEGRKKVPQTHDELLENTFLFFRFQQKADRSQTQDHWELLTQDQKRREKRGS